MLPFQLYEIEDAFSELYGYEPLTDSVFRSNRALSAEALWALLKPWVQVEITALIQGRCSHVLIEQTSISTRSSCQNCGIDLLDL